MGIKPQNVAVLVACSAGYEMLKFVLNQATDKIRFFATCHNDISGYEPKIADLCKEKGVNLLRGVNTNTDEFVMEVKKHQIDMGFLLWWPNILKKEVVESVKIGWVNNHPSLLPYGRGKHGYYWNIVEHTPFGVTLHFIDAGVDTGPILFQREIKVQMIDTGESLYKKSADEMIQLFKEVFPKMLTGDYEAVTQDSKRATSHKSVEIEANSLIELDKKYSGKELIDIIRARTFMQGDSAYFIHEGKKHRVKIIIEEVK